MLHVEACLRWIPLVLLRGGTAEVALLARDSFVRILQSTREWVRARLVDRADWRSVVLLLRDRQRRRLLFPLRGRALKWREDLLVWEDRHRAVGIYRWTATDRSEGLHGRDGGLQLARLVRVRVRVLVLVAGVVARGVVHWEDMR